MPHNKKQPAALLLRFPACETLSAEMLCLRELLTVLFSRQVFPQILLPAFLSFLICGRPPASDTSIPSHHLLLYALETGECFFCVQVELTWDFYFSFFFASMLTKKFARIAPEILCHTLNTAPGIVASGYAAK